MGQTAGWMRMSVYKESEHVLYLLGFSVEVMANDGDYFELVSLKTGKVVMEYLTLAQICDLAVLLEGFSHLS